MEEIIPDSIQAENTLALDHTYRDRLIGIGVDQLSIDLANESDLYKLTLYLQQFGIPMDILPTNMGAIRFRDLLQRVLRIYKQSGTEASIRLIAEALGATSATIDRDAFLLDHNTQAQYNSLHHYDAGREYRTFAIDVHVTGIQASEQASYTQSMRRLFHLFEPAGVYLRNVLF